MDEHFSAWLRAWSDNGLQPSALAQAGYRHYLQQPSARIAVKLRPEQPIALAQLRDVWTGDLIQALNLKFSINDGPDVALTTDRVRSTRIAPRPEPEPPSEQEVPVRSSAADAENPTIVVGRVPEWQAIAAPDAGAHIGDQARISLLDGSRLSGRIAGVDEEQLQLVTRSRQGEFTRPLNLAEISSIEVRP